MYLLSRWMTEVENLLKNEINPAVRDRNIEFALHNATGGPYLLVRILVPAETQSKMPSSSAPPQQDMNLKASLSSAPSAEVVFCTKCGAKRIDPDGAFCNKCGASLVVAK